MVKKNVTFLVALLCFIINVPLTTYAAEVTLIWGNSSGEVDGYRIYYGTSPGNHPNGIEVGNNTEYTVAGLEERATYYFVIRAYNEYGESSDSNELAWPVAVPMNLKIVE